jgi:uncharacterized damage-inducible protein DinB
MGRTIASRAKMLTARLEEVAEVLIAVIESVDERAWHHAPNPAVWSISKEADHVAEAALYHAWIVRSTIGETAGARRPVVERSRMTSERSRTEVAALIRERTDAASRLILRLSDEQLDRPTRPPRARNQRLAETIERVLIAHYDAHRQEIVAKLAAIGDGPPTSAS